MKYSCIIIDDEPLARELIATHLSHFENFELKASFENAIKAYTFLENNTVDLIFLDIEMPLLKGNDFLKKLTNRPAVIFTTAFREYALEGYELNVIDYLLKPITLDRFLTSIEKFKSLHACKPVEKELKSNHIFVPSGNKKIKIVFDDILYIESIKDYITIYLENGVSHHLKFNISAFEKLLDGNFLRLHRSYIVHLNKLTAFSKQEAEINEIILPVGSSYKDLWLAYLEKLII